MTKGHQSRIRALFKERELWYKPTEEAAYKVMNVNDTSGTWRIGLSPTSAGEAKWDWFNLDELEYVNFYVMTSITALK